MRPPRAYLVVQHLFDVYVAVLLGFVTLAVLIPAVVSARDTARRAVCTNVLRQHSGSCPDTVCLERGRIVWVSRCWACGSRPDNRIALSKRKMGSWCPVSRLSLKASLSSARFLTDSDSTNSISARVARPRPIRLAATRGALKV
jgi:hypothetical protein